MQRAIIKRKATPKNARTRNINHKKKQVSKSKRGSIYYSPSGHSLPGILDLPIKNIDYKYVKEMTPPFLQQNKYQNTLSFLYDACIMFKIEGLERLGLKTIYQKVKKAIKTSPKTEFNYHEEWKADTGERNEHGQCMPAILSYELARCVGSYGIMPIEFIEQIDCPHLVNAFKIVLCALSTRNAIGDLIQRNEEFATELLDDNQQEAFFQYCEDDTDECELEFVLDQIREYEFGFKAKKSGKVWLLNREINEFIKNRSQTIDLLWNELSACSKLSDAELDIWQWLSSYDEKLLSIRLYDFELPDIRMQEESEGFPIELTDQFRFVYSIEDAMFKFVDDTHDANYSESGCIEPHTWQLRQYDDYRESPPEGDLQLLCRFISTGREIYNKHYKHIYLEKYDRYNSERDRE